VHLDRLTLTADDACDGESWEQVEVVDTALPCVFRVAGWIRWHSGAATWRGRIWAARDSMGAR
jgi:hypothetical protein